MGNLKKIFDINLSDDDLKRARATFGIIIMIAIYTGLYALALFLMILPISPFLIAMLILSIGALYGAIGIFVQIILKTKPENIPPAPIPPQ